MSTYLRMWELIKTSSVKERDDFLREHPRAEGKDIEFQGQTFFDVDLLEAIRSSLKTSDIVCENPECPDVGRCGGECARKF